MPDLLGLLQRMSDASVDFVLVGGLAAVTHGSSLLTQDVDVCIRLGAENLQRLQYALDDLEPVHRMSPQAIRLAHDAKTLDAFKNLYLQTAMGQLDCLGTVSGIGDYSAARQVSVPIDLDGRTIRVLTIDALIASKSSLGRDRDREAVKQLKEIKRRRRPR